MADPIRPATIADLTALGLTGFNLRCLALGCIQRGRVAFDSLGLPETTPFPDITHLRRFTCSACGGHQIETFPDWSTHRPKGAGWV